MFVRLISSICHILQGRTQLKTKQFHGPFTDSRIIIDKSRRVIYQYARFLNSGQINHLNENRFKQTENRIKNSYI